MSTVTNDGDYGPRRYAVRHRTTYTYDGPVQACYERGFLSPRATATQRVQTTGIAITPEPDLLSEHRDYFGNHSHYVEIRTPHTTLEVTKTSTVTVDWPRPDRAALNRWTVAEAAAALADAHGDFAALVFYRLPSASVGEHREVAEYAATLLRPDQGLGDALTALFEGINRDFTFRRGATTVRTTLPELLRLRAGVCQDFTHLALGCLRAFGLPARYVSGYIETTPPPGRPKLAGSDASHAWVSVALPDGSWVDIDPTNRHFADSRYIVTAWGRDYRDVSPLKGVVFTESKDSTLEVAVDVTRLD